MEVYNGPFQLSDGVYYIRARAYTLGTFVLSDMASAGALTVVTPVNGPVQTPTISPPGGQYTNTVSVSVQAPDWSSPFNIRKLYTTKDGAEPVADFTSSGDGVSGVYNFNVSTPTMVKALSAQQGWFDSDVASAEYTFICDTPAITAGGTFTGSTNVSISTATSSAQPQNQTAATCTSAVFSVTAVGSAPFTYEWTKDGSIIGGATEPALTLAAGRTACRCRRLHR